MIDIFSKLSLVKASYQNRLVKGLTDRCCSDALMNDYKKLNSSSVSESFLQTGSWGYLHNGQTYSHYNPYTDHYYGDHGTYIGGGPDKDGKYEDGAISTYSSSSYL